MKKSIIFIFSLITAFVFFSQVSYATILTTTVTYELDGGTNHPNNPTTFNEFEDFYFGEATKEGHIFLGWFTDLNDDNTQVTRSKDVGTTNLTLYAKFEPIFNVTYNPNNGEEAFDLPANTGVGVLNQTINGTVYSSLLLELTAISDSLVMVYNLNNDPKLYARNLETGATITLGTLPTQNTRLTHVKLINNKTYVFGIQSSSLSNTINIYAVEIDNVDDTSRETAFPNIATATLSKPSSQIRNVNIELDDYNNDGTYEIFFKWSDSIVGSTQPRYAIIAYEFDDQALTFTETIDHVLSYRISDYKLYDIDQDGIKEIISIDASSKNARIFSYDAVNNAFSVLSKTISLGTTAESVFSNRALGDTMFVGTILGGSQVYVTYMMSSGFSSSDFISLKYFALDSEFNVTEEIPINTTFASRLFSYTGDAMIKSVQIDQYGNHAFVGIANYSSSTTYSYIKQHPTNNYYEVNSSSGSRSNSSMYIHSYFNGESGYILSPQFGDRQNLINFNSMTTFPSASVTKDGYRFLDWFTTEDFQEISEINGGTRITGPIEVYAKWDPLQYVVTFRSNGGTSVPQAFIFFDAVLAEPTAPTRAHYRFLGWKPQGETEFYDFTSPYTFPQNKIFDAQWENLVYEITHVTNTDQTIENYEANSLTSYTLPTNLEKEGHTFDGWYTTADFSTPKLSSSITLNAGDMTLYAKWNVQNYDIEFLLPDGTVYETQTFAFGADITGLTLPATDPDVIGTLFTGWETTDLTTMPASNIQLNMLFDALSYDLVYVSNGGNEIATTQIPFNEALTLVTPTRVGYTFDGWFSDEALTTPSTLTNMPAANTTLYAKWTINQYTITFDSNEGSVVSPITEDFASTVTAPTPPTRTGYTFNGWFSDEGLTTAYTFNTMPAENITLYAKWTINQYTITFDSNEGSDVSPITQDYATTVTGPATPTRIGYNFNGWFSDEGLTTGYTFDTMPAENITLYARWSIITYTITFDLDEGTLGANQVVTYTIESDPVSLLPATKEGHVFKGYYREATFDTPITSILPTDISNITVYALFFTEAFDAYLNAVNRLPNPLTIEDKALIASYLTTYDTFSAFEQGYVDRQALVNAFDAILTLEVERVKDAIDALPNPISLLDEADLERARTLYEALTPQQQAEVTNLSVLETGEDALEVLKVETLITSIPQPISSNSEALINEAKEALDALSTDLQDDVSNQALLEELIMILEIVKDIETLLNEETPTEEMLIPIQEQLQTLTEAQLELIDETVYTNYLLLEEDLTATSIWVFLGGGFSLLFLLVLAYLYYRYRKEKQHA